MIKKLLKITYTIILILFIFFVFKNYFSETNKKVINKNRSNLDNSLSKNLSDLPVLKNDTNNIIEYNSNFNPNNDIKKKRNFWQLLKINE